MKRVFAMILVVLSLAVLTAGSAFADYGGVVMNKP